MKKLIFVLIALIIFMPRAEASLISHWDFDEGSGLIAHDSSSNGYHGNIQGATWTSGVYGNALNFNGNGNHIDLPGTQNVNISNAITMEAWVKHEGIPSGDCILTKWIPNQKSFYLYKHQSSDKYNFVLWSDGDVFITDLLSNTSAIIGQWTHIAATYDGSLAKLYINGVLDSYTSASGLIHQGGSLMNIGVDGYGNHPFGGTMDDIRLYNHALTRAEILADMRNTPIPEPATMILLSSGLLGLGFIKRRKKTW